MLEEFLSRLLGKEVKYVKFLRNELPVNNVYDKLKTVDVLVLVDNEYVHIELNIDGNKDYLHNRNFIYFTEVYNRKKRGSEYNIKTQFIHIDLSYGLSKDKDEYEEFYVMSKKGNKYVSNIKIIEYNMDKIMEYWYNKNIDRINKYIHLIILDLDDKSIRKIPRRDNFVKEYEEKIEKLNEDETFVSAISYEEDLWLCKNSDISMGKRQAQKEAAKNMIKKGYKDFEIEEILNIDKKTFLELKNNINKI